MDLDGAYRLYAGRLFTYARGILGDHDSAADVVHDTFVLASQRSGQLRDPARLMSWLYTITRREALRHIKRRQRLFPVETLDDRSAPPDDPLAHVRHAEISELVWAAYGGLVESDREIIELSVRHGLSAVDIAPVLGVSIKHANARLSRARGQVSIALSVLLVARAPRDCVDLAELLGDWDGKLTPLLRKRLHRHIEGCQTCSAQRERRMDPVAILSGYAAVPFLIFAEPPRRSITHKRFPARNVTVLGVLVVVLLIAVPVAMARPGIKPPDVPTSMTSLSPGATTAATAPATAPVTQSSAVVDPPLKPPSKQPEPFAVTAVIGLRCLASGRYSLTVRVTANRPLTQAILLWQAGQGALYFDTMTIDPSKLEASGEGDGLSTLKIKWWVKTSSTDGNTYRTTAITENNPCV